MTDAPACGYDHVYVTVNKIRVNTSATADGTELTGWRELSIPAQRIDLLALQNGVLQELGSWPLPAGTYQQVRLVLADNPANPSVANPLANALVLSGTTDEIALSTPSGQQSGFKLQTHFDVLNGQVADMVLDFDACRSIVKAGASGRFNLKPVVSVIKRLTTAIEGYVDPALASDMAAVAGLVTNSSQVLLTDAHVSARQTLSTGQVLDIAATGVDATTATYNLSLPRAAAVQAPYASGAALTFTTDSMVAGRYNLTGVAAGYATQSTASLLDLGAAGSTTVKDLVLTP